MKRTLFFFALVACGETTKPADAPSTPPSATPSATATATATATTQCIDPSPGPGYECVQACGPPVSRPSDPPPGYQWLSPEQVQSRKMHGCPRCLHRGTKIATPNGEVAVERLHVGDPIWTTTSDGRRVATTVRTTSWTPAPREHRMLSIRLADGRVLVASPGHPMADGTPLSALASDGAHSIRETSLDDDRTFDVRPDGETGRYWAEGILLGSTLSR